MCTKFGTAVGVADVITCGKFFGDRLRGVHSAEAENCHLPLTKPVAINTGLALPLLDHSQEEEETKRHWLSQVHR